MTTTAPATELFVTCSDFCGAKITMTGENGKGQHYENCGAKDKELNALDEMLLAIRSSASDAAALHAELPKDPAPPAQFRCSCGETYDTWPELGDHQTATGHQGMWTEEKDALDEAALNEREDTVDGVSAKVVHNGQQPFVEVEVTDESVLGNLARAMETEATLRTAANTAKNALAHAVKKTKAAAEFAAQHWAHSRQMTMNITPGVPS